MKYAYARVSTRKQSRDGNRLDEQIEKLKAVGFDELIAEEFSGSTTKRPLLDSLIARTKKGFRDSRPPIDSNRKRAAAELILLQHKSYKEVSDLTGLSISTLARSVRALKSKNLLTK